VIFCYLLLAKGWREGRKGSTLDFSLAEAGSCFGTALGQGFFVASFSTATRSFSILASQILISSPAVTTLALLISRLSVFAVGFPSTAF
jgi:hypothetical protein